MWYVEVHEGVGAETKCRERVAEAGVGVDQHVHLFLSREQLFHGLHQRLLKRKRLRVRWAQGWAVDRKAR